MLLVRYLEIRGPGSALGSMGQWKQHATEQKGCVPSLAIQHVCHLVFFKGGGGTWSWDLSSQISSFMPSSCITFSAQSTNTLSLPLPSAVFSPIPSVWWCSERALICSAASPVQWFSSPFCCRLADPVLFPSCLICELFLKCVFADGWCGKLSGVCHVGWLYGPASVVFSLCVITHARRPLPLLVGWLL